MEVKKTTRLAVEASGLMMPIMRSHVASTAHPRRASTNEENFKQLAADGFSVLKAGGRVAAAATDEITSHKSVEPPKATWRTQNFWFLLLPFFICGVTTTGLMDTHLIPYAADYGFTPAVTGMAVSVLAAFSIFGTLVSGILADRWGNARMLGFFYLGRAASLVILVFASDPITLIIFAALFGLMDFATCDVTPKT